MTFETYQWYIFQANLDPVAGSEQRGVRPALVVSDENYNQLMPVVTILPLTSRKPGRRIYPNEASLSQVSAPGLTEDSIIMAHQIRTISKSRLLNVYGPIPNDALKEAVRQALKVHLTLD